MANRKAWASWAVAAVVGAFAGLAGESLLGPEPAEQTSVAEVADDSFGYGPGGRGAGDFMLEVIEEVRTNHVYIAPETGLSLTEEELAEAVRLATTGPTPVYLAWLPSYNQARNPGWGTVYDALDQLMDGVDEPGYYAVLDTGSMEVSDAVGYQTPFPDSDLLEGRPGPGLARYIAALAAEEQEPASEEPEAARVEQESSWGLRIGAAIIGVIIGLGLYLLAFFVLERALGRTDRQRRARR